MKIQAILDNYRALPVQDADERDINELLLAMFQEELSLKYEEEILSLVPGNTFEVRRVYYMYQGEDQYCSLDLLCVNEEPVCFIGRHGHEDSADPEVVYVNKEKAFVLATQLMAALSNRRLHHLREQMSDAPEYALEIGGSRYMRSLSDTTFGLRDEPVDQAAMLKAPFSTWILTGEALEQVFSFSTENRIDYGTTATGKYPLVKGQTVFQLGNCEEDRKKTLESMSAPGDWFLSRKKSDERSKMAVFFVREAHTWNYRMRLVIFRETAQYLEFMQSHEKALDNPVSGAFPYDTIPSYASLT